MLTGCYMKALFVVLLLLVSYPLFAQDFIGRSPARVKRDLDRHMAKTRVSAAYEQTDTTLSLKIRDPKYQPVDFIFRFRNRRCVEELRVGCDSCVRKYLGEALRVKAYGWTQVNESTYVSRRIFNRTIVLNSDPSSLVVRKTDGADRSRQASEAARKTN